MVTWTVTGKPTPKPKIPEVGEFWKHKESGQIYCRISDDVGSKALPYVRGSFFSINSLGFVVHTPRNNTNIELLKATFKYK